jgi:restriction system protein
MPIPTFQDLMLPLLKLAADGKDRTRGDVVGPLATQFGVTPEEQAQMLPSGRQEIFTNRIHWARTYLVKAGLLEAPKRGVFRITDRGRKILKAPPPEITVKFLQQFPEFADFVTSVPDNNDVVVPPVLTTPEETIEAAYQQRREALAAELLTLVKQATPAFFERLVVDLLVAMGYGGSRTDAGKALGRSGDEGVDGIIKEDRLGLDVIYLQAKRWKDKSVGRPDLQQFAGALHGQRARKGVYLTTSTFSKEARDFVAHLDSQIILIDGKELSSLMIDHNVGVTLERTYEIKRIDTDFFTEE